MFHFLPQMRLVDKKVSRVVQKLQLVHYEIFYSPAVTWIVIFLFVLIPGLPILISFFSKSLFLCVLLYFIVSYLVNGYFNNSFVLTEKELIIINPNLLFKNVCRIDIDRIATITIDDKGLKWQYLLCIFSNNYVQVKAAGFDKRFFCVSLDRDCFDENLTEKTLDDFTVLLRTKGIQTNLNID